MQMMTCIKIKKPQKSEKRQKEEPKQTLCHCRRQAVFLCIMNQVAGRQDFLDKNADDIGVELDA